MRDLLEYEPSCGTCTHFGHNRTPGGIKEERGTCLAPTGPHACKPHDYANWKTIPSSTSCESYVDVNKRLKEKK